jgi:hypothetical protein
MPDRRRIGCRPIRLEEESAAPIDVAQEDLIRQPHLDPHAKDVRVELLGALQIRDIDAEMVQVLEGQCHCTTSTASSAPVMTYE